MEPAPTKLEIDDATHLVADSCASIETIREALPAELRHSLQRASELRRRQRRHEREAPLATSVSALDHLLGGGLPRGALVEIVGRGSCGRFAAVLAALRAVTCTGEAAALVDQGAQLDPQAAAAAGVDLERLLWLRPRFLPDSLAAAEMLVCTGFPLVALDLGLPPVRGRAPLAAWLRLARSCTEHRAIALAGVPYRLSGCAAEAVVNAGWGRGSWSGAVGSPRLLEGLRSKLRLARRRGHRAEQRSPLSLSVAETAFDAAPDTPETSTERKVEDVQVV